MASAAACSAFCQLIPRLLAQARAFSRPEMPRGALQGRTSHCCGTTAYLECPAHALTILPILLWYFHGPAIGCMPCSIIEKIRHCTITLDGDGNGVTARRRRTLAIGVCWLSFHHSLGCGAGCGQRLFHASARLERSNTHQRIRGGTRNRDRIARILLADIARQGRVAAIGQSYAAADSRHAICRRDTIRIIALDPS